MTSSHAPSSPSSSVSSPCCSSSSSSSSSPLSQAFLSARDYFYTAEQHDYVLALCLESRSAHHGLIAWDGVQSAFERRFGSLPSTNSLMQRWGMHCAAKLAASSVAGATTCGTITRVKMPRATIRLDSTVKPSITRTSSSSLPPAAGRVPASISPARAPTSPVPPATLHPPTTAQPSSPWRSVYWPQRLDSPHSTGAHSPNKPSTLSSSPSTAVAMPLQATSVAFSVPFAAHTTTASPTARAQPLDSSSQPSKDTQPPTTAVQLDSPPAQLDGSIEPFDQCDVDSLVEHESRPSKKAKRPVQLWTQQAEDALLELCKQLRDEEHKLDWQQVGSSYHTARQHTESCPRASAR